MSGRIAHRPHYRNTRQFVQHPLSFRYGLFRKQWTYRCQTLSYEKHSLGYGLSLIPMNYRLPRHFFFSQR